ncbi:MAG: NAD-dependent epimerase/dehydratase family protein [Chitinophagaceae bacterium]|nr:NAD-dependent epimerase/dehydratase family protein [Chitinophagaceae bacterium]
MKSVLITGVAGLIGSRMAEWIRSNRPEYQVIGVDDLSGGYRDHVREDVVFHQRDLSKDTIDDLFSANDIRYVFHFSAYAAEGLSPFIRMFNYNSNLVATANVVNNCIQHGIERLVFTSSMAVYGIGEPPFDEADLPNPIDPYGVAKYACEMDIRIAGEQHQLDWCIIRPHNVYGCNQNIWDKYRNVLGIWMYKKLNNEPFTIFGDGLQKRAFSYVDDCLEPLWNAATRASCSRQIINLGGITHTSLKDAAALLSEVVGGAEIVYLEQRHEVKNALPSYQKSIDLLDYVDKTGLKDGLTQMWNWARQQPDRPRMHWEKYEVEKGVYTFWK